MAINTPTEALAIEPSAEEAYRNSANFDISGTIELIKSKLPSDPA
jgi:hypothetical protein